MINAFEKGWAAVILVTLIGCTPSIDPAMKAALDQRAAQVQISHRSLPAPHAPKPMPLRVGQWIELKLIDGKGHLSFLTYKMVGEKAGAYWVETVTESYWGRSAMKMLVDLGDRKDPKQIKLFEFMQKDKNGKVNVFPEEMVGLMRPVVDEVLSSVVVTWEGLPQEDVQVPAGRFVKCFKGRSSGSFGPFKASGMVWWHPAVPINGLVKSVGIDNPSTMELVAFGLTGAKSEF